MSYIPKTHPQQGYNEAVDDRATTWDDFNNLNDRFGFSIDVAASDANTKCSRYYTRSDDGLGQSWANERVWCNPPYSVIEPWVLKAWAEWEAPDPPQVIVMLLPSNRTEQHWWQNLVEPRRDRPGSPLTVEFLPGRLRFLSPGEHVVKANSRPPFGCCLLIWGANRHELPIRDQMQIALR